MIKKINFKLLIFIFLLSTSYSMSNECELEFDIGDNVEKIFNDMGLEKGSIIEETYLDYYEQETNYVCPDSGMNGGIMQVYIKDDEVIGIKFKNSTYDEENFNEDNLIYYYVKKNLEKNLIPILPKKIKITREYCIVIHEDLINIKRIRVVVDFMSRVMKLEKNNLNI